MRPLIYRFGVFELEPNQHQFRQRGHRVRLSGSQTRLLTLFVSRAGQLITRDEIAAALWSDSQNIDVTNGINTAVNRLRGQLGDDPGAPNFIETVVGTGYRFIAQVEEIEKARTDAAAAGEIEPTEQADADNGPDAETNADGRADSVSEFGAEPVPNAPDLVLVPKRRLARWHVVGLAFVALAVVASVGTGIALWHRPQRTPVANLNFLPHPMTELTFNEADNRVLASAVSPDGNSIAYSDRFGVSVHLLRTDSDRKIPSPSDFGVDRIAWDTEHSQLIVSGLANTTRLHQAWTLSLMGEPPRLLLDDAGRIALSPDGRQLAFTRKGDTELWIARGDGQNARLLLTAGARESFAYLLWSPTPGHLLFERFAAGRLSRTGSPVAGSGSPAETLEAQNRWSCETIDTQSGKILDVEAGAGFSSGFFLPDGRLFYTVNEGYAELKRAGLMLVRTDPATGRFLAAPKHASSFNAGEAFGVSASADGRKVSAVLERRNAEVFEAAFDPSASQLGSLNRVTSHSGDSYPHAWTPAGDAIVFESSREGSDNVYEQKVAATRQDQFGGELLAHVQNVAAMAEFTPDGQSILFMQFGGNPVRVQGIYRVPAEGGAAVQIPTSGPIDEFHCSLSDKGICALRETVNQSQFVFYALDPVTGMGAELGRISWSPSVLGDWSISPDGKTVAAADHDAQHPGIRFVALGGPVDRAVTEVPIDGFGALLDATWAPDGKSLFAESRTDTGYDLLFIDADRHTRVLRESPIPIWAAPSRDGKKLAFPAPTINTNVWVGDASPY